MLALVVANTAIAKDVASSQSRLLRPTFFSKTMRAEWKLSVYLPAGYDETSSRRYPVIYLLHGLGGGHRDFFDFGELKKHLDTLIGEGRIRPVIAVAVDGGRGYWTNQRERPGRPGWRYADMVALDALQEIDANYKTHPHRHARAIAGVSMGGYGAFSIALLHTDKFVAAVSLSGALFEKAPSHREIYHRTWGNPPNALFFEKASPRHLMQRLPADSQFPALYVHCGDRDGLGFLEYAQKAQQILEERQLPHVFSVTPGGHRWEVWGAEAPGWLVFVDGHWQLDP
jgi:enterochelin esterase-like enzyme